MTDINQDIFDGVINDIMEREHIFMHSCGGSGKSVLIHKIKKWCQENSLNVAITASTGVSAFNIGGSTIHSYAGIGIANKPLYKYVSNVKKNKEKWDGIRALNVLIIDEISMIDDCIFEFLNNQFKELRYSNELFGGITLILSGDLLQLPPVNNKWFFQSPIFEKLNPNIYTFHRGLRYTSQKFFCMLLRIRSGEYKKRDLKKLYSRLINKDTILDDSIVRLYSHNKKVDQYNKQKLDSLEGEYFDYKAIDTIPNGVKQKVGIELLNNGRIMPILTLKKGARVMLLYNLDTENGLVNGSCGEVLELNQVMVKVKFDNGIIQNIIPEEFEVDYNKHTLKRSQMPLNLSYSVSIHKSQGLSMDKCVMDLTSCFASGQAYVALSRVRSLEGIYLIGFNEKSIKVDKDALEFERNLNE